MFFPQSPRKKKSHLFACWQLFRSTAGTVRWSVVDHETCWGKYFGLTLETGLFAVVFACDFPIRFVLLLTRTDKRLCRMPSHPSADQGLFLLHLTTVGYQGLENQMLLPSLASPKGWGGGIGGSRILSHPSADQGLFLLHWTTVGY